VRDPKGLGCDQVRFVLLPFLYESDSSMDIARATLDTCASADGVVVAIDVLRAFSTAAFAFAAGAREIVLAGTVEEALALRERFPGSLLMGEVDGLAVEGFDFSNSPVDLLGRDLSGRRMIQRTSAGTQGMVRSVRAEQLLAASFVCADATARFLRHTAPASVTFVITGIYPDRFDGDEDAACADYLAALLRGETLDPAPFLQRVRDSGPGRMFADPACPAFLAVDLDYCTQVDRFGFAMLAGREDGLLVMRPVVV
jgi:2-phosphosulfolactate phosphatase